MPHFIRFPSSSPDTDSVTPCRPAPHRPWAHWLAAGLAAGLLAACGSSVKLDEVPVSDRAGVSVDAIASQGAGGTAGAAAAVDQRGVAGVQVPSEVAGQPPATLARLVYFDYDSYTVRPEFAALLESHARFLNADRQRRVVLEGHTDERGGREYNLALGQKRAEAVRRAMGLLGVSDAQMEAVSFGKEKPANPASTEEAYSQNRRVELNYR
jgi:peptidoglycan-associated lipoprotein